MVFLMQCVYNSNCLACIGSHASAHRHKNCVPATVPLDMLLALNSFKLLQDIVNNATSVYMEDALQFDRSILLAPVGLGYEFIHDILDTANYAHGQDQAAGFDKKLSTPWSITHVHQPDAVQIEADCLAGQTGCSAAHRAPTASQQLHGSVPAYSASDQAKLGSSSEATDGGASAEIAKLARLEGSRPIYGSAGRSGMQNTNSPRPIPADNVPETSPKSLNGRYPFDMKVIVPGSSRAGNSAGQTRRNGALLLRQATTSLPTCASSHWMEDSITRMPVH